MYVYVCVRVCAEPRLRLQLVIAENVTQAASVRVKFEARLAAEFVFGGLLVRLRLFNGGEKMFDAKYVQ